VILDGRQVEPGEALRADVCVIGSGAAGITAALELARAGLEVVLLEAGGRRAERDAQDPGRGLLEDGTDHDRLELVRQRRLGGTTAQWGGRCAPLQPIDFEARDWVAGSGWPISYETLLPFYERAHAYCDLGRFEYAGAQALPGAPPLAGAEAGSGLEDDRLWRWSPPVNFWRRYRGELEAAPGLRLVHHANVLRLERGPVSGSVERAVVGSAPGRGFEVGARAFVVAAGGLESARLLLVSELGNEHDLVGRFYMTHPVAEVGRVELADPAAAGAAGGFLTTRDGVYCRRMLRLGDAMQREHRLLNLAAALWYPEPGDPKHSDALLSTFALVRAAMARGRVDWKSTGIHSRYGQIEDVPRHLSNVARGLPAVGGYGAIWARRRWLSRRTLPSFMTSPRSGVMRLRFDAEQSPDPANRVTLSPERDAYGVPRLSLAYRVSAGDRESIGRSLALIGAGLEKVGVGRTELPAAEQTVADVPLGDGTHQLGVTRMAHDPGHGVVDRDCRVFGAGNLFVASSSVFPTAGAVGPTLTIVALAIRIADLAARELTAP
jgi:choline dehydrogenase-like flavoprotein